MAVGLILAAPSSGSGKTVLTLALLRAFARCEIAVSSFKVGPDYIDPAFHTAATGRPCRNLDLWAMRPETLGATARDVACGADLVIGEGVMGLFDGAADGTSSTADAAVTLGLPVVLVVNTKGQGASVAALVKGFRDHRSDVTLAGVILNNVGSEAHRAMLTDALEGVTPVLGCVHRDQRLELPERHLGLVQAAERPDLERFLDDAAEAVGASVDLDRLMAVARPPVVGPPERPAPPLDPLGQRIAIAQDTAFAFVYPALLDGWRHAGAELVPFSPLADEAPDSTADAVYLPGGYPELHAGELASNDAFLEGLKAAAARGVAVFGECGGFMVLGERLIDGDGESHVMAGLLPAITSFSAPRLHLGYRRMTVTHESPLGPVGTVFRGHEFHYARLVRQRGTPLFQATDATGRYFGPTGAVAGRVAGSFLHVIDREGV
ncbi:MAG: cobyrinate a,c-diamide synthase [Alphaproteobacteria bacterium]|nr:cobyrinate a,c-diamide synthase [Alphaproteobacteria bacterium]